MVKKIICKVKKTHYLEIIFFILLLVQILFYIRSISTCSNIYSTISLSNDEMQDIFELQLSATAVVTTIINYFFDKANVRRLGLSYKRIYYHDTVFGKYNVVSLTIYNIFCLGWSFLCVYIFSNIDLLWVMRTAKFSLILSFIINMYSLLWLVVLYVISKYKESIMYEEIIEKLMDDYKTQNQSVLYKKIIKNRFLDYKNIFENINNYNSYIEEEISILLLVVFIETKKCKREKGNNENENVETVIEILDNIAIRLKQRDESVSANRENVKISEIELSNILTDFCKKVSETEVNEFSNTIKKILSDFEDKEDNLVDYKKMILEKLKEKAKKESNEELKKELPVD